MINQVLFSSLQRACAALALLAIVMGCGGESEQAAVPAAPRSSAPLNLILITVDTLRADHVGAYGGELGLTPNLDAFAAESIRFDSSYATAPITLPSMATLMSGMHPPELGIRNNLDRLRATTPTLADRLRSAGWRTGAVVSNYILGEDSGINAGFELFDAQVPDAEEVDQRAERTAGPTTDAALAMLASLGDAADRAFLLWVHYLDPHGPYTPPPGMRAAFLEQERSRPGGLDTLPVLPDDTSRGGIPHYQHIAPNREVAFYRAGYDGEIHHLDAEVGRLLAAIRSAGLFERSLVVFTADHGEALGEDNLWFAHGSPVNKAGLHVPLLIRAPSSEPGVRRDAVSLVDLHPTLLAMLKLPADARLLGRDLFSPGADELGGDIFFGTSATAGDGNKAGLRRNGDWYVRRWGPSGVREQLFREPDFDRNLAWKEAGTTAALRAVLDQHYARLRQVKQSRRRNISPEARERLSALGYTVD